MAKLLIIDDQISIAKKVAEDIRSINSSLGNFENVFCLDNSYNIVLLDSVDELKAFNGESSKIAPLIIKNILKFASEHKDEEILIMLDYALKEETIGLERINNILSTYLYAGIIMCLNKAKVTNLPTNFSLIMYSANDLIFNKLCPALKLIYEKLEDSEKDYFPKECYDLKNISWVNGGDDSINTLRGCETRNINPTYQRLLLPKGYREYISKMR